MGRSWRKPSQDKRWSDDYEAYSKSEIDYRNHKSEKKVKAALSSFDVEALSEDEVVECDWCPDHVPAKGYWRCPKCDAEWPDEEETDDEYEPDPDGGSKWAKD